MSGASTQPEWASHLASGGGDDAPRIGRLDVAELGQDLGAEQLDQRRVVRRGEVDDDVLHAGLGESAEALDDLVRRLRRAAP